jgi:hydroxyacylglutathione hydrolase
MLQVEKIVNELMSSNCYIAYQEEYGSCIVIDPGTESCEEVISFINSKRLQLDYVILTHEHTDHTWGCNTLIDKYNPKVVCSQICKNALPKEGRMYFQLYYDSTEYEYAVKRVDMVLEYMDYLLNWNGSHIKFIPTPGHSEGSVCFSIEENLFTGDTIMQYKPFISKKNGSIEKYRESINKILTSFDLNSTRVYPGHGESFYLKDFRIV